MIYFTAFHPDHIRHIEAQTAQEREALLAISAPELFAMAEGVAFTAWRGAVCLGAGGIVDVWPGRATAWALLSRHAGPHLKAVTKHIRSALDGHPAKRIECTVLCGFGPGHRWARLLGFACETRRMKSYDPMGRDMSMYVRIK